ESARQRSAEEAHDHEDEDHDEEEAEAYGTVPNTSITSDGGSIGFSWIGDAGYIGAAWSGFNTLYGVPSGAHNHEHEHEDEDEDHAHEEEGGVRIDLVQRRFDVQGALTCETGF